MFRDVLTLVAQVAVYYLPGTLVGCLLGGWVGDQYGRVPTIGLGAVWSIIGAWLQCSAQNATWMYCGSWPVFGTSACTDLPNHLQPVSLMELELDC